MACSGLFSQCLLLAHLVNSRHRSNSVAFASQQELAEAACLLDLSEYRLDDLLSEPVPASPSGALELVAHGLCERPGDLSFDIGRVLGTPRCDVAGDLAFGRRLRQRFYSLILTCRGVVALLGLLEGEWKSFPPMEVMYNARVVTASEYQETFGTLPNLPIAHDNDSGERGAPPG